jgi:hypothetical protein
MQKGKGWDAEGTRVWSALTSNSENRLISQGLQNSHPRASKDLIIYSRHNSSSSFYGHTEDQASSI